MPRKHRTPESVAQNRDSQRRSRARRQQLIDELRSQLHEYEQRGVAASLELQRAARQVARENARLRALLGRHGVQPQEIEAFVRASDQNELAGTTSSPDLCDAKPPTDKNSSLPPTVGPSKTRSHICQSSSTMCATPQMPDRADESEHDAPAMTWLPTPNQASCCRLDSCVNVSALSEGRTTTCYARPTTSDSDYFAVSPRSDGVPTHDRGPRLEMSCVAAADIIAGFYGHRDAAQALVELGCSETADCVVKNTEVLQLMDGIS